MQKINLRDLYPDTYKTDVFVDVAEEVLAAIRGHQQDDAAYERRKFRHKAHYSLNREDGIENDALNRPLTPEEILEQKQLREEVYAALMKLPAIQARQDLPIFSLQESHQASSSGFSFISLVTSSIIFDIWIPYSID